MSTYAPEFVSVPCVKGDGTAVTIIDAALYGRQWRAQPFNSDLSGHWEGADVFLPDGFINHAYNFIWTFQSATQLSLVSGSLPPGLTLTVVDEHTSEITGTPSISITPGTLYTFTLRATTDLEFGDSKFQVTIYADPDEGVGGVGGG